MSILTALYSMWILLPNKNLNWEEPITQQK